MFFYYTCLNLKGYISLLGTRKVYFFYFGETVTGNNYDSMLYVLTEML